MVGTWRQIDALARTLYLESVSMDELQQLSRNKEQLAIGRPRHLAHRPQGPAQQPHRRLHPAALPPRAPPRGRPHRSRLRLRPRHPRLRHGRRRRRDSPPPDGYNGGYGHQVLLNHEFGYKTRYAHLSDVLVKPGDTVDTRPDHRPDRQHRPIHRDPTSTTR